MKPSLAALFKIALLALLLHPSSAHANKWLCSKTSWCRMGTTRPKPAPEPVVDFASSRELNLPYVPDQSTEWSCGPNSAARVLLFHGYNASYDSLKRSVVRLGTFPGSNYLGTAPHELRRAMHFEGVGGRVRLERQASFLELRRLLSQGKPVIALVRNGTLRPGHEYQPLFFGSLGLNVAGTWPAMHYFVVTGYDENQKMISYTETNGATQRVPYDQFLGMWGWGIGRGVPSTTLKANGVETRTMLWVD